MLAFDALFRGGDLRRKLIRGGIGSAVVQAGNRLLMLLLGILLARGLGAEGYGIYAYTFATMSLLMVAAEAGTPTLLMREVAAAHGRDDWSTLRSSLQTGALFVVMSSACVTSAGLVMLWAFAGTVGQAAFYSMLLMLFVLPLTAVAKTFAAAVHGLQHVVAAQAVEMLLRPLAVIIIAGWLFYQYPSLRQPQFALAAQLAASVVVLAMAGLLLWRVLPASCRGAAPAGRGRRWFRAAVPFAVIGAAGVLNNQTDLLMLGWFREANEVGIYRVAMQGAILVAFTQQAAGAVVAPQFARLFAQADRDRLQRLLTLAARLVTLTALPLALLFIVAGDDISAWVFGAEFADSHLPLAILASGQLIAAGFGLVGPLLTMTGRERFVARTLWQTALLNVALNLVLIPLYGSAGASIASAVSLVAWNYMLGHHAWTRLGLRAGAFGRSRPGVVIGSEK